MSTTRRRGLENVNASISGFMGLCAQQEHGQKPGDLDQLHQWDRDYWTTALGD